MYRLALAALATTTALFVTAANAQQDFSKVEIKTTDLGNKTYRLEGADSSDEAVHIAESLRELGTP